MTAPVTTSTGWLARVSNPAGMLYGSLIGASVLATASVHTDDYRFVGLSTGIVLGVYWMAHVYVEAQRLQLSGDRRHALHRLRHTAAHESGVIIGGVPGILVFTVAKVLGASTSDAASYAVYFSVAVLLVVGYVTATQAGRRGAARIVDSLAAGAFGVVVIIAKALLH